MLKDYQKEIDDFLQDYDPSYWTPHEILARITEEVGEVARLVNHTYGPKRKKPGEAHQELGEELADVLYGLICMANREGIDLDNALSKVILKAKTRDKNRFAKKSS